MVALFYFSEGARQAEELASACAIPAKKVEVRQFPDGESLVRVREPTSTALLFRSLDNPNQKLIELLLACSALRAGGTERIILVAPYLGYMRQDVAFREGEAVSQRVIGGLLARWFDGVVTVDPHLHRIASLGEVICGIPALALSAAPALMSAIDAEIASPTLLVGPDSESRPWVESIAGPLGLEFLVGEKIRKGDRDVSVTMPDVAKVRGKKAVVVDDIISSGTTLIACLKLLREAGATEVEVLATHALATVADLQRLADSGISRLRATDSTSSPIGTISLAKILAEAIRCQGWN